MIRGGVIRWGALAAVAVGCGGKSTPSEARWDAADARATATPAVVLDAGPTTPPGAASPYRLAPRDGDGGVRGAGSIAVKVEWKSPPAAVLRSPGINQCGAPRVPGAVSHHLFGLGGAVVWLTAIGSGRAPDADSERVLEVRRCVPTPRVVLMPRLGSRLTVLNSDERRHRITMHALEGGAALVDAPMPLVGQRFAVPMSTPGVFRVATAADPADRAYVVVPRHPYYAITDHRGEAVLTDVPPGRYELVAWHPPFARGEGPRMVQSAITVETGKRAELTVSMAPK